MGKGKFFIFHSRSMVSFPLPMDNTLALQTHRSGRYSFLCITFSRLLAAHLAIPFFDALGVSNSLCKSARFQSIHFGKDSFESFKLEITI